ncbi:3-oxoacyl-[acyl-carrier protein] reductase [Kribbella voronezhensis]|uniref:3-oxoacyl-[acyl-carrier protein] reductase n=1 Tax=Kribbella voronezhensis TaxID=2512212 RepID=A0A4R7SZD9_9ACTN|nr:SDR family oxidoreductase [Kribbella voronezhensis]TDU84289.1 3-oxoacyl-[acyl-carrier protein] reductase [Kribbella voronezhensis]
MSRTIVVTGGATGIGRAVAERFVAGGDDVVITGRRVEVLEKAAADLGVRAVVCDGTDPAQVEQFAARVPARVDVLVNNAGGNTDFAASDPSGDLARLRANWLANLEANVLTAVLMTTALAPKLADGGAVIHLGSIAAAKGAGSYGASKAALATWNLDVAADLGPRGITSNVVAPGFTAETEFFRGQLSGSRRETLLQATLIKREGTPSDIAETIWFLASPGARHLTAQVLHVNGGALPTR